MAGQPAQDHGRTPWPALLNALSVVGGGVGVVLLFVPDLRDQMEKHALAGWAALFAALILIPSVAVGYSGRRLEGARREERARVGAEAEVSVDSRVEAARLEERTQAEARAAMRYANRDKDVALIEERLGEWTLQSSFFEYLVAFANHGHYRRDIFQEIYEHVDRWDRDDREISDSQLRESWGSVHEAARRYRESLMNHMWGEDDGEGGPVSEEFLRVPIEWKTIDPERSRKAHEELDRMEGEFITALRAIFKQLHSATAWATP